MAKEIERKFLVEDNSYKTMASRCYRISQGYLSRRPEATVRVRVRDYRAFLTIKGITCGCERNEWEYEIPLADAIELMRCCEGGVIEKVRYLVDFEGFTWEIDEFHGAHEGLVVAEIELPDADCRFPKPGFVGREVTDDPKYYNSSLAGEG